MAPSAAPPTAGEMAAWIKREASRLGFVGCGITMPEPPPHLDVFARWLESGRHGEMGYLATTRARAARADPRQLLPEARSVIVLAANYAPAPRGTSPAEGQVAAYARGDDYHDVLPRRAKALLQGLEALWGSPIPHRIYTDTGPLLEREWAQRAGLGWIGKNTCLIHPAHGSLLLLTEILLGLELPADAPFEFDRCGTCTRCLEACPTQCILPDRTIDARRCISYLTIELRGPIPRDLRPAMGTWIFGCDICQDVCPWNRRFAVQAPDPSFQPREGPDADVTQVFLLATEESARDRLRGSPLKRPKRRGLARNAAVAAGNGRVASHLPALEHALHNDRDSLVRRHAAWGIGRFRNEEALTILLEAQAAETDPDVQEEIVTAAADLRMALSTRSGL